MTGLFVRLRRAAGNKKGMTMANVLVAFAVLALTLLLFQQAVTLASNIFRRSEDLRRETEALFADFYENAGVYTPTPGAQTYVFTDESGNAFQIQSGETEYPSGRYSVHYFGGRS